MKPYLISLLMLISNSVWADWELVGNTQGDEAYYIDMTTLRIDDSLRRVWTLTNLKKKGSHGEMSVRILREIDCKNERFRSLAMTGFTGAMSDGEMLHTYRGDNNPWDYIAPRTVAHAFYLRACSK